MMLKEQSKKNNHCRPVKHQNFYMTNISLLCSFMLSTQFTVYKYFAAMQLFKRQRRVNICRKNSKFQK